MRERGDNRAGYMTALPVSVTPETESAVPVEAVVTRLNTVDTELYEPIEIVTGARI